MAMREDIQYKRTLIAYKDDYQLPEGTNPKTGRLTLPSGEVVYHMKIQDRRGVSAYACALELSGCSFYYIPEPMEVLYILSRIRSPRYQGGHEPRMDGICDVWRADNGHIYVRIGLSRISVLGSDHNIMSDGDRREWRDYLVSWIEDHLILQEDI